MKLIEVEGNTAAFVFGRFNPPTIGHKKLYDKLASVSDVHFVFVSPTQDNKKIHCREIKKLQSSTHSFLTWQTE
jgi:nicotinamide mononucleotide adenylyltransferase